MVYFTTTFLFVPIVIFGIKNQITARYRTPHLLVPMNFLLIQVIRIL